MPYCRRCGAHLEENARFCQKCGTQVIIFASPPPAPPAASSTSKSPISTPIIVLIAVLAVTAVVIAGVFVVLMLNPVSSSQAGPANQTNVSNLSFKVPDGKTQTNSLSHFSASAGPFQ